MMVTPAWVFGLLYFFLAGAGVTAAVFLTASNRRAALLTGAAVGVMVIAIVTLNLIQEAPERRRLIALEREIRDAVEGHRSSRATLEGSEIEMFWQAVVPLRNRVAAVCAEGDQRLNDALSSVVDLIRVADGLSALASRLTSKVCP